MKHLAALIFILNLLNTSAQETDSLLLVAGHLHHDTDRVMLFYKEGFAHRADHPQYSYNCAQQAEKFAQRCGLPYYAAKAANLLGILYYRKGDLTKALGYHKKALGLRTVINDQKGIAMSQTNLGNIYTDLQKYMLAEKAYLQALSINSAQGEKKQIGNCLMNLGVLKTTEGSAAKDSLVLQTAAYYFHQAIQNAAQRSDYGLQASCLNNLSVINIILGKWDESIANCENAIKARNMMDNEMEMADSYLNLALTYLRKNSLANASENLKIADSIIRKYDYISARVQFYQIQSDYFAAERNFEKAYHFLLLNKNLRDSLEKIYKQANASNNFTDQFELKEEKKEEKEQKFPYLYFNGLAIMAILIGLYIFKHRQ